MPEINKILSPQEEMKLLAQRMVVSNTLYRDITKGRSLNHVGVQIAHLSRLQRKLVASKMLKQAAQRNARRAKRKSKSHA